jgi:uncharacterized protein involved in exopolysaccharide biosynthesis/protein involved in polysaccharide export with SLBB domain
MGSDFQARAVWEILRSRLWLIAGLGALGFAVGLVVSSLMTKSYSASATVEVNKPSNVSATENNIGGVPQEFGSSEEMTTNMLTLQQELQSATVGLRVIEQTHLASAAPYNAIAREAVHSPAEAHRQQEQMLAVFESHLKVDLVKDTKLLSVTFTDGNPDRAAEVANAVIDTYIRSYAEARMNASERTSATLTKQLAELRDEVLESERRVTEYKERTGIVGPENNMANGRPDNGASADSVVVDRYLQLNRDLTSAEVTRVAKQALESTIATQRPDTVLEALRQEQMNGTGSDSAYASNESVVLAQLRQQETGLKLQIASRGQYLGPASPQMMQLQKQLAVASEQLHDELDAIRTHVHGELRLAQSTEAGLRSLVHQQQQAVTTLNVGANQLRLLQQEANSKRALYQDLFSKLQQANVSKGVSTPTLTLIDAARAPISKSTPKTGRNALTGAVLGGLLGVMIAFIQSPGKLFLFLLMAGTLPLSIHAQSAGVNANVDAQPQTSTRPQGPGSGVLPGVPRMVTNAPLGPGFLVHMEIFGVPEMSTDLRVTDTGAINVPLLGLVSVQGMTATQAADMLAKRYIDAHVLVNAQITITVLQYATISVSVLGEVQAPGEVQLAPPATLERVLALAGGDSVNSGGSIELQRRGEAAPTVIPFQRGAGMTRLHGVTVNDGDTVYVHRAGIVYVLGAVTRPGGYQMIDGGTMNVLEAVALAQGNTLVSTVGTLYIIRPGENGTYRTIPIPYKKMEHGKQPPVALLPRDVVYVPTSTTKVVLVDGASLLGAAATSTIYAVRTP